MKRTISEMFDNLSNEATRYVIQTYEIKENVDDMSKQRVYKNVMSSIDEGKTERTSVKRGLRKTSIAAVAIVAALAIAGTSVAAGKLYKSFTDYKPAYTEEQKAAVEKATFAINESITVDGATITAVEGLFDGEKLFILATTEVDPSKLTIPEGHSFFSRLRLHVSGDFEDFNDRPSIYNQVFATEGNTCTELYMYDVSDVKDGQQLALSAWGLATTSADGTDSTEAINRDDKLGGVKFKAQKSDFSKTFSADSGVKLNDTDFAVTVGYVSPWAAQIRLSGAYQGPAITEESSQEDIQAEEEILNQAAAQVTFKVVMKDGTVYEGTGVSSSPSSDGETIDIDYFCAFKEYVDTANIDHVEVSSVKLNVK